MWLASVSRWTGGPRPRIIPTYEWRKHHFREMEGELRRVLSGVGDRGAERYFRMIITACLHRTLTDEEAAGLPENWQRAPAVHLAGGPIEVFWQHGVPEACRLSTSPCHNPVRQPLDDQGRLWLPLDCGDCPPCTAREEMQVAHGSL